MEDFNPDDPLDIDARREDENEKENNFKAMKEDKDDEQRIYDRVYRYLTASCYQEGATKVDMATTWKR